MDSVNRKEATMKRLTATLATVSLVIAVGAPIASAKAPSAKAYKKASMKQSVRPGQKLLKKGLQVRITRKLVANF